MNKTTVRNFWGEDIEQISHLISHGTSAFTNLATSALGLCSAQYLGQTTPLYVHDISKT